MKKSLSILSALGCLLATSAMAQDAASPVTANVALTSSYKYRGQDQGDNRPAISGGFDYSKNGFYVGNWNSSIKFAGSLEMDVYAGYKGEYSGFGYDVGVLTYYYPERNKAVSFNTTELYGALTYSILTFKYSHTVSKDYFGIGESLQQTNSLGSRPSGRNTGYYDLSANYPLMDKLTLNAHVGFTRYSSDLRDVVPTGGTAIPNYTDYKIGATYDLGGGFSGSAAYVGANKKDFYGRINQGRVIVAISKTL
ncbi:MAG: hypothetical protein JWP52_682 [Rhizobacter sp.]|jgi:uncharacterized protein (TIGR02001 family)|nr:hypothetical protein [Rhizobacter sp.]